jgi:hypothetical protein
MAGGKASYVWSLSQLAELLDERAHHVSGVLRIVESRSRGVSTIDRGLHVRSRHPSNP